MRRDSQRRSPCRSTVRVHTTRFGPAAPQALDSPLASVVPGMDVAAYDEHACLTLNVWAPDEAAGVPVLVWFHGGSFVIGSASQPVYDGALLAAEQQVVVVTVNYRLGALGFLDARPLGGVANAGVRDAICALEWVRENISFFGGDPTRVVAFGESAGGGLLLHALASPAARGLLAGAIVQSGATFATLDEENAAVVRDALVKQSGGADLATIDIAELIAAQTRAMGDLLGTIGMMPFHPMVDDEFVPATPPDALAAGAAGEVPLLLGTTSDEMRLFVGGAAISHERLVRRVSRYLHIDEEQGAEVVARYGNDDAGAVWCSVFSDYEMVHPARAVLDAHAAPARRTRSFSRGKVRTSVRATASTSRSRSGTSKTAGRSSRAPTTTCTRCRTSSATRGPRSRAPVRPVGIRIPRP